MAQTIISRGDALAVKHFGAALFAESIKKGKFRRNLKGPAPKQAAAVAKMRTRSMQSSPDMPIVSVTDLQRGMGDQVTIDLFNALVGMPIMGDQKISGRGVPLKRSTMNLYIDQMRQLADPGGRMSQHRTIYDLRTICRANLAEWFGRLLNQLCHVHMAGARGSNDTQDWAIPLESHPEFESIVVNDIVPPSKNRRFYAGGKATSVSGLTNKDALLLDDISRIRVSIDEMTFPPSPCKLPGDQAADDEDPMYVMYVSPRQWYYLENATTTGNDWRSFLQNALMRGRFVDHPLFKGGAMGMWSNILVRKLNRPIRFQTTDSIKEGNSEGGFAASNPAVETERAIILGAQALCEAWGNARPAGDDAPARWIEEWTDHQNALEISGALIGGYAKVRFKGTDDNIEDFGVMTVDSYAPGPHTTEGAALLTSVRGG